MSKNEKSPAGEEPTVSDGAVTHGLFSVGLCAHEGVNARVGQMIHDLWQSDAVAWDDDPYAAAIARVDAGFHDGADLGHCEQLFLEPFVVRRVRVRDVNPG